MPKPYNIYVEARQFDWGEMTVLALGEDGRGRKLTLVPFRAKDKDDLIEVGKTRSGKPSLVQSSEKEGWIAQLSSCGGYRRGASGGIELPSDAEEIASGYGAFGAAGRVGGYREVLAYIPDNRWVKIIPTRGEPYYIWFGTTNAFVVRPEEIDIFLEVNQDAPDPTK